MSMNTWDNGSMYQIGLFSDTGRGNMYTINQWNHVTMGMSGSYVYWYKNGVYQGASQMNGVKGISVQTSGAYLGKGRNEFYFNGEIAFVRAYNRRLTNEEIAHNYSVIQSQYGL